MIFQLKKYEVNLCSPNCKTVINILVQVYSISKPVQALVKENSNSQFRHVNHSEISDQSDRF